MYRVEHQPGPPRRAVVSCQQFSVTVSSGTSSTATINPVDTSRSVIIPGGMYGNSTVTARILGQSVLTNATTVTVTRGVSVAATLVAKGTVVEFAPWVVSSIQTGTITPSAATTGTATITAVDTSRSLVIAGGAVVAAAASVINTAFAQMTLTNATTVTAKAGAATSNSFGFTVIEFQSAALARIAAGALDATNTNTTDTVTLAPNVETPAAVSFFQGQISSSNSLDVGFVRAALTDGATVTQTRTTGTSAEHGVAVAVAQLGRRVVRRVHRGTITITAGTTGTATIEAVDLGRSWVMFLGMSAAVGATPDQALPTVALTAADTVTATLGSTGTITVSFEVVTLF